MMVATRASSKRSRAGCWTCKIRHTKCGEERPGCLKCLKTGRKCDGYSTLTSSSSSSSPNAIVSFTEGTRQERRALYFFRNCTVPEFCGYFPSSFWEIDVLQVASTHAASRHAAVALGACHESLLSRKCVTPGKDVFVLQQYSKAIYHLRNSLSCEEGGGEGRTGALTAATILVSVDSLLGNVDEAAMHLRSCIAILESEVQQSAGMWRSEEHTAEMHEILSRLGRQIVFYVDGKIIAAMPDGTSLSLWPPSQHSPPSSPGTISTLDGARSTLDALLDRILQFFYGPASSNRGVEREKHARALRAWSKDSEAFLASRVLSGRSLRGAVMLKIHALVAETMLSSDASPPGYVPSASVSNVSGNERAERLKQMAQHPALAQIVNLAASLIAATESATSPLCHQLSLSAEMGVIGPLYYAGLWTSDSALRERIVWLLECKWRREGVWDSFVAGRVLREIWEVKSKIAYEKEAVGIHERDMESATTVLTGIGPKAAAEVVLGATVWERPGVMAFC